MESYILIRQRACNAPSFELVSVWNDGTPDTLWFVGTFEECLAFQKSHLE